MTPLGRAHVLGAIAIAGCLAIAGCGSDDTTADEIRIGSSLADSYDPVLFEHVETTEALQLVYTGLLTYAHEPGAAGAKLIPGLAEAMPAVSADRRTYTFKLRPNLRYSDGSPVVASDFENTIKRLNYLGGLYAPFTENIAGVSAYMKAKKPNADISGITTDDATGEIVVKLSKPDTKILYELGLPNAAPTPRAKSPFEASRAIPGIGPYTIRVTNPNREYVMTKTPGFDIPGIAKGNIDKITVVKSSVEKMTQDVIDNKLDFMTEDPAGDLLPQVRTKYASRFRMDPNPPNTYWFFLNDKTPPFDKLAVRRAVNYAIDSRALQRIFGGRLEPTCNFLPPAYARIGYKEIDPCPYGDPAGPPDLAKARDLVAKSGYENMSVTVWGNSQAPYTATVEYLRDLLDKIGFKAKTRILDPQVYFKVVDDPSTRAQIGFTNWMQDFPHPANFFEPNLSNPELDAKVDALAGSNPATNADEWAALDRSVIDDALIAVYGNQLSTSFFSERMDVENCSGVHPAYRNDWSLFCLK